MGGDCWEIKDQIGEKNFRGARNFRGDFWGKCQKRVEKLFGGSKKWWEFFWGSQQFFGGRIFQEKFKKKKSPAGILWKIVQTNLGGSYTGGRVWGECWEIKDKIGEKQIQGARDFGGGDFLGKCQKRGGKTFWRFQKVVGIFLGVTTIFGGENFSGKI